MHINYAYKLQIHYTLLYMYISIIDYNYIYMYTYAALFVMLASS